MPLSFLCRLQHVQLPVRVAEPEEIRHVCVLAATGLIVAELVELQAHARYATPGLATVLRITDEGRAEIAKTDTVPKHEATPVQLARGLRLL